MRIIDEAGGDVPIDKSLFDADGEVEEQHVRYTRRRCVVGPSGPPPHSTKALTRAPLLTPAACHHDTQIVCARCRSGEADDNNDIVLCDGECCRAYHLGCLALTAEQLPPDDVGWLCPSCDAKFDAVEAINTAFDMEWDVDTPWTDIFADEAARDSPSGDAGAVAGAMDEDVMWPSDEEGDDDFDPAASSGDEAPADGAAATAAEDDGDGDDEESGSDDDADGSDGDGSESDTEPSLEDHPEEGRPRRRPRTRATAGEHGSDSDAASSLPSDDDEEEEEEEEPVILEGKRRRAPVDYIKLAGEMFGGISDGGEPDDDDWCGASPMSPLGSPEGGGRRGAWRDSDAGEDGTPAPKKRKAPAGGHFVGRGFPEPIKAQLRAAFEQQPLPSKAVKEELAQRLGLTPAQVSIWFNNSRQRQAGTDKRVKREDKEEQGAAPVEAS